MPRVLHYSASLILYSCDQACSFYVFSNQTLVCGKHTFQLCPGSLPMVFLERSSSLLEVFKDGPLTNVLWFTEVPLPLGCLQIMNTYTLKYSMLL